MTIVHQRPDPLSIIRVQLSADSTLIAWSSVVYLPKQPLRVYIGPGARKKKQLTIVRLRLFVMETEWRFSTESRSDLGITRDP